MNKNVKRNEKYLLEFEKWLNKKELVNKNIRKHLNNEDFFIKDNMGELLESVDEFNNLDEENYYDLF